jgi:hypothetical protein
VATGSADIAHNTVMSYAWLAYLLLTLAILGQETGLFRDAANWIAAPRHREDEAPSATPDVQHEHAAEEQNSQTPVANAATDA